MATTASSWPVGSVSQERLTIPNYSIDNIMDYNEFNRDPAKPGISSGTAERFFGFPCDVHFDDVEVRTSFPLFARL